MRHLFLEGPVQEGKSTLIRRLIAPFLNQIGGFGSQRLLDGTGATVGFRITPAAEAVNLTREYDRGLSNIFLHFDGSRVVKTPEVFAEATLRYLTDFNGKKLILLDEIGGMELSVPAFRETLYQVLAGGIPCIGVLKLEEKNRHMCEQAVIDKSCLTWHQRLKTDMTERFDAELVPFSRSIKAEAERSVRTFLNQIFDQ
ncbi:MAG: hypothetical protein K0Q48_434 [Bacillota bacterium]|jgi:nucleoside-triphosphatase|nr:hypothetical protein [Bacillota bacterium]